MRRREFIRGARQPAAWPLVNKEINAALTDPDMKGALTWVIAAANEY
jgi:hypothetical protein